MEVSILHRVILLSILHLVILLSILHRVCGTKHIYIYTCIYTRARAALSLYIYIYIHPHCNIIYGYVLRKKPAKTCTVFVERSIYIYIYTHARARCTFIIYIYIHTSTLQHHLLIYSTNRFIYIYIVPIYIVF